MELTNWGIIKGLKAKLDCLASNWVDELPRVLRAHHTTYKVTIGEMPYSLVYGLEAMLPSEMGLEMAHIQTHDPNVNPDQKRLELDLAEEK